MKFIMIIKLIMIINHMKINPEKSQVLLSSNIQRVAPFCNAQISSSTSEKLLGTSFTWDLKFEEHISKI